MKPFHLDTLFALALFGLSSVADANKSTDITPRGIYATIDIKLIQLTLKKLLYAPPAIRDRTIAEVSRHPSRYAPPVFYAMSRALYLKGDKDKAAFWFYAGQLRARYDLDRSTDETASQHIARLDKEAGPAIHRHMFAQLDKFEQLIRQIIDWDRRTPHHYDHRWINLHGVQAMVVSTSKAPEKIALGPLSRPRGEWPTIADKTRAKYLEGFLWALGEARKRRDQGRR